MEIRAAVRENNSAILHALPSKMFIGSSTIPAFLSGKRMAGLSDFLPPTNAMAVFLRYLWMRLTRGAASAEFCSNAPATS
jgi:hypothetical protein